MRLRTFIAVDMPADILNLVHSQIGSLQNRMGNTAIRWTPSNNLHLTIKFLGNTEMHQLDGIKRALQSIAEEMPAFDLSVGGFGSFPNPKRARVLWVGIQAPAEFEALHERIETACRPFGFPPESRPFSPHLTIGRVRENISSLERGQLQKQIAGIKIDALGTARVDSIHLYKSDLKPGGAVYEKLYSTPLATR